MGRNHSDTRRVSGISNVASVLVVDDEYDIIDLIRQSLQMRDGQRVCAFTSPSAALEHWNSKTKENRHDHSIVISDIRMPGMNGYEFVKQIKKIDPRVRVILMSAFEIDTNEFSNVLPNVKIDFFLQKPFTINMLRYVVQENKILS